MRRRDRYRIHQSVSSSLPGARPQVAAIAMLNADLVYEMAQQIASNTPGFFEKKGPGAGDRASNEFMRGLRQRLRDSLGVDYAEVAVIAEAAFRFDFYFPDEATVVEVALSLWKPRCEYEIDILKCILAIETGASIRRLVLISKPGASARQAHPGRSAVAAFAQRKFGFETIVRELTP